MKGEIHMRYFIALVIAALMTSGAFNVTSSLASDDEQSQEEQSIEQEDTQMIEQGSDEQMQSDEQTQSDESEQGK